MIPNLHTLQCPVCTTSFQAKVRNTSTKYCSVECKQTARSERDRKLRADRVDMEFVDYNDFRYTTEYRQFTAQVKAAIEQGCRRLAQIRQKLGDAFRPAWFYDAIESIASCLDANELYRDVYVIAPQRTKQALVDWGAYVPHYYADQTKYKPRRSQYEVGV